MKPFNLFLTLFLALFATTSFAGPYFSITGQYLLDAESRGDASASGIGSAPVSIDFKDGLGITGAIGTNISPDVRAELEVGYKQLDAKAVSATIGGTTYTATVDERYSAITTMGNLIYDIPTGFALTPYIGAGLGWAHLNNDGGSDTVAYQGLVGVNYKLDTNSTVFAGYRYIGTGDFKTNYTVSGVNISESADARISSIDVGYRYSF